MRYDRMNGFINWHIEISSSKCAVCMCNTSLLYSDNDPNQTSTPQTPGSAAKMMDSPGVIPEGRRLCCLRRGKYSNHFL
jgi:hypothetical protein